MGYNTSGKHSWLGHKDHNALLDVAADHGMLLSLAPFFSVLWVDFYKWIMSLRTQEKESSVIKMQLPFLLMRPRGIYNCYSMMIITRIECLQRICKGKTPNVCEVLRYSRNIGLNI